MNISCRPSSCARLSLARTTTAAPLPCRIFIDLRPIALRHSGLGNPRLRYNNYGTTDCRIWRPPFTAYCRCVVISSCSLCTTTTMRVSRYDEYSYLNVTVSLGTAQAVIQSIRILSSYLSFITPFSRSPVTDWLMVYPRHATLPVRFPSQISRLMIGYFQRTLT